MDKEKIAAMQYEERYSSFSVHMVAIFNTDQISAEEVEKALKDGSAESNKHILLVSEEKWVRILRDGRPF